MTVAYENLSPEARVWIYQADRVLSKSETNAIKATLDQFVAQWQAHGEPVRGYAQIYHHAFLVLMADSFVSGCSIDSSVRVLKEIEQQQNIKLFNRLLLAYLTPLDNSIHIVNRSNFEQLIDQKQLDDNTIVFDNLVANKAEFEKKWQIPLKQSPLYMALS